MDCRESTIDQLGELKIPIAAGVISEDAVLSDLSDLVQGRIAGRRSDSDVTVLEDGGGAHLDLMTASFVLARATSPRASSSLTESRAGDAAGSGRN